MMEKQSIEFISGYIFSKIEDQIKKAHINKLEKIENPWLYVPKSWFGMKDTDSHLSLLAQFQIDNILIPLCHSYNTEDTAYSFSIYLKPMGPYIMFHIEGTKVQPPSKEMTVEEIEKELGYKIKIVGGH